MTPPSATGLHQICGEPNLSGLRSLHGRVVDEILAAVADRRGPAAAEHLRAHGLDRLHEVIEVGDVGPIRDHVLETLRPELLRMAVRVGRSVLGWEQDFYVDDYLILRINLPYDLARRTAATAENPGIGRVSPAMRPIAQARRTKDPLYDPAGYHRGHPPAAWAHGPHIDSWTGHSRDGINIWWAMVEVPAEAGMVLYPEVETTGLTCDRRTLYLQAGQPLPPPTFAPLAAGEMLVFDPEILHGTHLNVTDRTRVAVSLRLNAGRPTFAPEAFYAREFWRSSKAIEAGDLDAVEHVRREDNLAPPTPQPPPPAPAHRVVRPSEPAAGPMTIARSTDLPEGGRLVVELPERRIMVARQDGRLSALDARCPHYGVDLMDGGARRGQLHCPACAVAFDLSTGGSTCSSLALTLFRIWEADGAVMLDASTPVGAAEPAMSA
ncbi:MAG: Rieske 2Fe-2S domain-containing protein [Caulobacter sp.]